MSASAILSRDTKQEGVRRGNFVFYFDNPSLIEQAEQDLIKARDKLKDILHDSLDYEAKIYVTDDLDKFNRLIRGKFPDWGAAAAFPERELVAIKSPDKFNINKSLEELLAHEYSHLATAHRTGFNRPPRWIDEGLAMYISSEWGWSDNMAMSKAAVFGQFIPLMEIEKVNRFNESKAQVAYSTSYLAVEFLLDAYGRNSIDQVLEHVRVGYSVSKSLELVTGSNLFEFQQDFENELNKRFNIMSLFMDTIFFWIFLALIMVVGFFIHYKKRRQYYKKWEEEEKLHSTDFDYGDTPEEVDDDEPWRE